jgi:hypothetical protein
VLLVDGNRPSTGEQPRHELRPGPRVDFCLPPSPLFLRAMDEDFQMPPAGTEGVMGDNNLGDFGSEGPGAEGGGGEGGRRRGRRYPRSPQQ